MPKIKQVLIVNDPYIDESAQRAKLLIKWPLDLFALKQKAVNELKPCRRLKKKLNISPQQDILSDSP